MRSTHLRRRDVWWGHSGCCKGEKKTWKISENCCNINIYWSSCTQDGDRVILNYHSLFRSTTTVCIIFLRAITAFKFEVEIWNIEPHWNLLARRLQNKKTPSPSIHHNGAFGALLLFFHRLIKRMEQEIWCFINNIYWRSSSAFYFNRGESIDRKHFNEFLTTKSIKTNHQNFTLQNSNCMMTFPSISKRKTIECLSRTSAVLCCARNKSQSIQKHNHNNYDDWKREALVVVFRSYCLETLQKSVIKMYCCQLYFVV
jgi:hypothetical protein